MKTKYKTTSLVIVIALILYLLIKYLLLQHNTLLYSYFDLFFYCFSFFIFLKTYGIPRNKNYLTRISTRYIIILLLFYILIIYLLGCFVGFLNNVYRNDLFGIINNIWPLVTLILFREFIRFSIANQSKINKQPFIILTVSYIAIDIFNSYIISDLNSFYLIFNFLCLSILPSIARHLLLSYMTYNISINISIIYSLVLEIGPIIVPIVPNLGNYLNAILYIFVPFITYLIIKKIVLYKEKASLKTRKYFVKLVSIPLVFFLIIIVSLVSGVFKYKMIAIATDSMNPIYYRGDAIIYEKSTDIKEGDILVYEYNNRVITHRVINIIEEYNRLLYQTKGDNNNTIDLNLVSEENVLGKVRFIVKYVGYPTVLLSEIF